MKYFIFFLENYCVYEAQLGLYSQLLIFQRKILIVCLCFAKHVAMRIQKHQPHQNAYRKEEIFLKINETWLGGTFIFQIQNQIDRARLLNHSVSRMRELKKKNTRTSLIDWWWYNRSWSSNNTSGSRKKGRFKILYSLKIFNSARKIQKSILETWSGRNHSSYIMFVEAEMGKLQYEIIRNTVKPG